MPQRSWLPLVLLLIARSALADDPTQKSEIRAKLGAMKSADGLKRMEWKVGETSREALVYLPAVTKGAPLVFAWHGHGGTMRHASRTFTLHTAWPEAIVVYAQGLPTPGGLTDPEGKLPGWQFRPGDHGDRDLKFFDAMLETFKRDYQPDPKRVFAMGHSNGGRLVHLLWATRADEFAAFAPVASTAVGLLPKLKPCIHLAGEGDKIVPVAGQRRTIEQVKKLNGCESEGKRWGEFEGTVTFYKSSGHNPLVTAIYPGGHEFPKEAPRLIVKFFQLRDAEE